MQGVQGLYDAGVADSPGSVSSSASKVAAERDYVGVSAGDVVSGAGSSSADDMEETDDVVGKEDESSEEELELGLSLGTKTAAAGAGAGERKPGAQWEQRCRILTAKDFPSLLSSRASPRSSSTSSVSSSSGANPSGGVAGTKRAAADSVSPEPAGGTPHPPSNQVVVGWPPIRAFRMNSLFNQSKDHSSDGETVAVKKVNHHGKGENDDVKAFMGSKDEDMNGKITPRSSLFVKVNMDGDPIGRKVDVAAHHSYETLAITLDNMFQKHTIGFNTSILAEGLKASKLLDGSSEFSLTYEDKDGDWMLVGDVPWGRPLRMLEKGIGEHFYVLMFLDTVKRLRIMRTSDVNGLGPRLQSSCKARPMGSKHS